MDNIKLCPFGINHSKCSPECGLANVITTPEGNIGSWNCSIREAMLHIGGLSINIQEISKNISTIKEYLGYDQPKK